MKFMAALDIVQADQESTMYRHCNTGGLINWGCDGFIYVESGHEYLVSKNDLFADDWEINTPVKMVKKWKWAVSSKSGEDFITIKHYSEKGLDNNIIYTQAAKLPWTEKEEEEDEQGNCYW